MSPTIATTKSAGLPALQINEQELMQVLQSSLYPGAQEASIKLVINYCKASGLDPMQKPVHLVPMSVKKGGTKEYEWRDVVMPGIGLYRTQAARSGAYAGMTEPEFGEDITENLGGTEITYPRWCRTTVKRQMSNGAIVEFTSKEFWKENYATAGKDSVAPNAMWRKRPYAQIAKCCEAQALRKAFPEIGAAPTAEEMEGKPLAYEGETIDGSTGEIVTKRDINIPPAHPLAPKPSEPKLWPADRFAGAMTKHAPAIANGTKTADDLLVWMRKQATLTADQEAAVLALKPTPISGDVMSEEEIAAIHKREMEEAQS